MEVIIFFRGLKQKITMKGKHLITTDDWFIAPDGRQYQAVYGECKVLGDDILGVKTNSRSTNWYVRVGSESNHILIAGCQIHYAVKCENPHKGKSKSWEFQDGEVKEYEVPCRIYFPD